MGGFRRLIQIVFGLSIAFAASSFFLSFFGDTIEMLIGYVFVVAGILLLIRGWRQVYLARRQGRLATTSIYGVVRHPQYDGIFLAVFGQLVHWPTILTLLLAPIIAWAYVRLAYKEEALMTKTFGD